MRDEESLEPESGSLSWARFGSGSRFRSDSINLKAEDKGCSSRPREYPPIVHTVAPVLTRPDGAEPE